MARLPNLLSVRLKQLMRMRGCYERFYNHSLLLQRCSKPRDLSLFGLFMQSMIIHPMPARSPQTNNSCNKEMLFAEGLRPTSKVPGT
jgi:hypothetical protein